jgi:tRNA modification GTPase
VVIAGQPNAGKSSLLNALAGAELAIVTPIAGTTRDKVQQTIQIEGVPLHVIDTAGLRDSDDEVERIGIARAWDEIAAADAVLFLHDLTRVEQADYAAADADIARTLQDKLPAQVPVIHVWNKTDMAAADVQSRHTAQLNAEQIALSARTGDGLDALRKRLLEVAGWQSAPKACTWPAPAMWRPCRPWMPIWRWPTSSWLRNPPIWTCWPRSCAWPSCR